MKFKVLLRLLLGLLFAVVLLHLSFLFKLIPYTIAWGGRLKTDSQMYVFESLSLLVIFFLVLTVLMKGGVIKFFRMKTVDRILRIYAAIFALNTVGNLFAETSFEKYFAGVTLLLSVLILLIVKRSSAAECKSAKESPTVPTE